MVALYQSNQQDGYRIQVLNFINGDGFCLELE
jgi:hypothetical protein